MYLFFFLQKLPFLEYNKNSSLPILKFKDIFNFFQAGSLIALEDSELLEKKNIFHNKISCLIFIKSETICYRNSTSISQHQKTISTEIFATITVMPTYHNVFQIFILIKCIIKQLVQEIFLKLYKNVSKIFMCAAWGGDLILQKVKYF